jgi:hypothetical protein
MHNDPNHRHYYERHPHTTRIASTRQRSRSPTCEPPRPRPDPHRWALVQVWNGAVLATFAEEPQAREAMTATDDDEVVILHIGT